MALVRLTLAASNVKVLLGFVFLIGYLDGFMSDCGISIASALEVLQCNAKLLICRQLKIVGWEWWVWCHLLEIKFSVQWPYFDGFNFVWSGWNLIACAVELWHFDRLVQKSSNSSALAMELRLFCTDPSICTEILFTCNGAYRLAAIAGATTLVPCHVAAIAKLYSSTSANNSILAGVQ